MTLGKKLVTSFLGCSLIPLGIVAYVSYSTANSGMETINERGAQGLEKNAYNQLVALRDVKKAQIETYFGEREGDMGVLVETVGTLRKEAFNNLVAIRASKKAQIERFFAERMGDARVLADNPTVKQAMKDLDAALEAGGGTAGGEFRGRTNERYDAPPEYVAVHDEYFPMFKYYMEQYGYYDVFLMDPDYGDISFTVTKEADFGGRTSEMDAGSLADAWRAAAKEGKVLVSDTKPYAPSAGAPAQFVAAPIKEGGETIGVVVLQISLDAITAIMSERSGMGETGEAYLVGQDQLMRSDSYLDPEHHSVVASLKDPSKGSVGTEASKAACAGKTAAKVILDYNDNPVLSAYTSVSVGGATWGLLVEIDVAEAFCPKDERGVYFFKKYADMYGYYDLFLLNPDGYCFYTVCQEADYQTNLVNGKYADSGLGVVVRDVLASGKFGFADFKPYAPSNGAPAAFIAQPVIYGGEAELVVALQLPLDAINKIMGVRSGMGETGETYLIGPDKLMRSDSFLDSTNHSVVASFKNPAAGSVDTDAATAALGGATDAKIIIDYNGNPVLSAYTPIDVFGTRWALLAEIDESEALAAVREMQATSATATTRLLTWVGSLGAIAAVLITLISIAIARSISKPINRIIAGLDEGADQVNDAAQQVSSASQQLAEGASEQASSLEETSSALEQMAAMTRTNAENAKQANELSEQARRAAQTGDQTTEQLNTSMAAINNSSGQISKIIKVIEEIAFQTNLLALNAAVEAARAGEHGKGFAVVADEVRNLAQRAAQASGEITTLIDDSVSKAKEGTQVADEVGKALAAIVGDVTKVTELINGIAQASQEQAQGVDQVNTAVSQMDKVTQQNAAGAEESASAAEELNAQAQSVKGRVDELAALVSGDRSGTGAVTTTAAAKTRKHYDVNAANVAPAQQRQRKARVAQGVHTAEPAASGTHDHSTPPQTPDSGPGDNLSGF